MASERSADRTDAIGASGTVSDVTLFDPAEPTTAPDDRPTERIRLVLAYDGTRFHGFAPNPDVLTVGGVLRDALTAILRTEIDLTCAGRTDKGVHARAQVVTFDTPADTVDLDRLPRALGKLCGPDIVVRSAEAVRDDFDARFSAVSRRYRYEIDNSPIPDPLDLNRRWHVPEPLDLAAMRLGCDALRGEHDFASFCRRPKRKDGEIASLHRRVTDLRWIDEGDGQLVFEIEADAFCHQMVRAITGTLVDVGRGRIRAGDLRAILLAADRNRAGTLAPPQGLVLWQVRYDDGWTAP